MATIKARPFDFTLVPGENGADRHRHAARFIEPGGFGATLGNDVSLLQAIIPAAPG